jgi:hypothetical protein
MRTFLIGLALAVFSLTAIAKNDIPDPKKSILEDYASIWEKQPWERLDDILSHYATEILYHDAEGNVTRIGAREWIEPSMESWQAEGWAGSTLIAHQSNRLNPGTYFSSMKWRDDNGDEDPTYSCGWYLFSLIEGQWKLTVYADINCPKPRKKKNK